jgi:hypothetical protein
LSTVVTFSTAIVALLGPLPSKPLTTSSKSLMLLSKSPTSRRLFSLSRQLPHFQSRPSVVLTGLAYLSLARVAGSITCVIPGPQNAQVFTFLISLHFTSHLHHKVLSFVCITSNFQYL